VLIVDTVGFTPGILSADGRIPHSDQLHIVERFSLDPDTRALKRSYVADDPLYFEGQYTGSDVVYVADVPYQRLTCDDRSYKSRAGTSRLWWVVWTGLALVGGYATKRIATVWRTRPPDSQA
jgi:hypothetical protein